MKGFFILVFGTLLDSKVWCFYWFVVIIVLFYHEITKCISLLITCIFLDNYLFLIPSTQIKSALAERLKPSNSNSGATRVSSFLYSVNIIILVIWLVAYVQYVDWECFLDKKYITQMALLPYYPFLLNSLEHKSTDIFIKCTWLLQKDTKEK